MGRSDSKKSCESPTSSKSMGSLFLIALGAVVVIAFLFGLPIFAMVMVAGMFRGLSAFAALVDAFSRAFWLILVLAGGQILELFLEAMAWFFSFVLA
jgi:hypothetical protein